MLYILIIFSFLISNTAKDTKKKTEEENKYYIQTYYDEYGKPHKRKVKNVESVNTEILSPSRIKVEAIPKTEAPVGPKEKEAFKPKASKSQESNKDENASSNEMPDFSELLKNMGAN